MVWEARGGLAEQDDAPEELEATHETMLKVSCLLSSASGSMADVRRMKSWF
jgi:hypothetical protein